VTNGVHSATSRLALSPLTRNSSGSYYCYDKADGNVRNQKVLFLFHLNNVQEAPAFVTPQPSKLLSGRLHRFETNMKVFSEIVPPGNRFRLSCNLNESVTNATQSIPYVWLTPKRIVSDANHYFANNEILPWDARWKTYVVGPQRNQWILEVRNASFLDTGYYGCFNLEIGVIPSISSYYIYVPDKSQMILPPNVEILPFLASTAVYLDHSNREGSHPLGCGPTDPSVTVDLWDSKGVRN